MVQNRAAAMPFIMLTLLLTVLGFGLIIPVLPKLVTSMAGGTASTAAGTYGIFVAIFSTMQFLFAPVLGTLSDQYGRRPIILLSVMGAAADYLLLSWAPSLEWLFVGRVISGVTGANITAINAYVADVSPPETRAQNYGLLGAVFGLGFILGPMLGGLLGTLGPRVPFLGAALVNILNAIYGALVLPESLKPEHRRPFSWERANPFATLKALQRFPSVQALALVIFLTNMAQGALETTWVLFTSYRFSWTELQAGMSLGVVGLSAAVVQGGLTRKIIPALGERKTLVMGMVFTVGAFILYGSVPEGWMLYPVLLVGGLGGLAQPAAQALVSQAVGPSDQGSVQGSIAGLASLTRVAGPLVFTQLFQHFTAPGAPVQVPGVAFFGGAAFVLLALAVALRAFRRMEPPPRVA